jgi:hypothetical protein
MNSKLKHAIQQVENKLSLDLSSMHSVNFIEQQQPGYRIQKNETEVSIHYHNLNDALTAIGILLSNPKSSYLYDQTRAFKRVGLMLDVARMAVPKIETLEKYILILSLFGYNYLGLYLEDVFEVDNEPKFGYMRGRYTQSELKRLDDFSASLDFEIVPYIQTLAHLASAFKHFEYASIKDIDDILLVGEPRTYELIENMLKTTKKVFRSPEINIGMDEAWMLGLGKYLQKYGYQDRLKIMFDHLEKVNALCIKYNYKPAMWADMFFHLVGGHYFKDDIEFSDEIKSRIPQNMKLIYWDYYQTDIKKYHSKFKALSQLTHNYGYAGGAWKWIGFSPSNDVTMRTMSLAIEAAKDYHIEDFIITAWGDNGGEASQFSILPGLLFIIQQINGNDRLHLDNLSSLITGLTYNQWLDLDLPNRLYKNQPAIPVNPSKYLLYEDPFLGLYNQRLHPSYDQYYQSYKRILKADSKIESSFQYIFISMYHLCDILSLKSTLSIRLKQAYDTKNIDILSAITYREIPSIIRKIEQFYQAFYKQWHLENKPFGFEHHSHRLGGLKQRLTDIANDLHDFINASNSQIPALEERIIELANDPYNGCRYLNYYGDYTSFGKM